MRSEKGQAIVFLALGFVAFLGFVALAIDGGMLYADRRHAQSSSDASALAGAGTAALVLANEGYDHPEITFTDWYCTDQYGNKNPWLVYAENLGINAAMVRGTSNNFTLDTDQSDLTYVTTNCVDVDNGALTDAWLDVTVQISDTTETSFAQLLFPQPLRNVVSATARVFPRAPFGFGHAIVALREECLQNPNEGGAHFSGSNNVYIDGGGIWSNACVETSGGNNNIVEVTGGGENVCIPYQQNADGTWISCYEDNGDPDFSPSPDIGDAGERLDPWITPPNCSGPYRGAVHLNNNQSETIDPGVYDEITVNGGTLYLEPGLYCVIKPSSPSDGNGNVFFNGGTIEGPTGYVEGADDPFETGVSFFLDKGSFATSGNATVRLTASMAGACDANSGNYCQGIFDDGTDLTAVLVYLAESNPSEVTLVGTGDDKFTGLIFAPGTTVNLVGNGDTVSFNLQVIADTIDVGGNAVLNIDYDKDLQRWTSAMIELAK